MVRWLINRGRTLRLKPTLKALSQQAYLVSLNSKKKGPPLNRALPHRATSWAVGSGSALSSGINPQFLILPWWDQADPEQPPIQSLVIPGSVLTQPKAVTTGLYCPGGTAGQHWGLKHGVGRELALE